MKKDAYIQDLANSALKEFDSSKSYYTQIQEERNQALRFYMQLPMGNEVNGFSKYITSDVRDTVDWSIAQLMEMFVTGASPIRFNPVNAQDVDLADLETKYTSHVIFEENDGFLLFNTWFKDALISKNGIVKAYWEERHDEIPENYESIGYDEYILLLNDNEYEVKKVEVESDLIGGEFTVDQLAEAVVLMGEAGIQLLQSARFEVKGIRHKDSSGVKIENVAPERAFISANQLTLDLSKCDYFGEQMFVSRNELIAQGFEYDLVMNLPTSRFIGDTTDSITRYTKEASNLMGQSATESAELIEVIEHYIRDSKDKNPKLYCIKTVGDEVIDWEEVDKIPYHVITPKINPYRFYGDSLADEVIDIQYARSNLWRSAFDNIKYSVVPRTWTKGDVDLEALNDYVPSANIPCGADAEINTLTTPFVASSAIDVSNVLEQQRAERTGFSKEMAGLDPSALANSTNMMGSAILNLSALRTKMIASTFANTGVKSLFLHVRELMLKYERRDKLFNFNGKFVTIQPRSWIKSRSSTVKTGLGHAGKLEAVNAITNILALQEKLVAAQGGVFGDFLMPENIYKAIARSLELVGVMDVDTFFKNPEGAQPPPPEPSLQDKQTMAYVEVEKYKTDKRAETDIYKAETDASVEIFKTNQATIASSKQLALEYQKSLIDQNELIAQTAGKRLERSQNNNLENRKLETQRAIREAELVNDLSKARIDAKTKVDPNVAMTDADLNPDGSPMKAMMDTVSKTLERALGKLEEGQVLSRREQNEVNKAMLGKLDKMSKPKKKRVIKDNNGDVVGMEEID